MQGHTDALKLKLVNWVDDMTKINSQNQISFIRNGLVTLEGEVQSIIDWRKHYIESSSFNTRYRLVQEPQNKIESLKKELESVSQEINVNLLQLKSGINVGSDPSHKEKK
ncbi:UNKNOWN [Stylonychia lemnae]|uniref:Uncharacterized protein n=1 Tax=Stylonychia lemnae TaxID=5949 RepID=A0A078AZ15_STYLE|nr:UNKNOWN [Stylonychia lemnae]|eukprot:CDW86437.1 UNKNOWN [Stylonychia lemnae]